MIFPSRTGQGRTFSGFSKPKHRLARHAGVQAFIHDLRRTASTRLAGMGVAPHVVERLLNHVTGILGVWRASTTASSTAMTFATRCLSGQLTCGAWLSKIKTVLPNRAWRNKGKLAL